MRLSPAVFQKEDLLHGKANITVHAEGIVGGGSQEEALIPRWIKSRGTIQIGPGRISTINILGETAKGLAKIAPLRPEDKEKFDRINWRSFNQKFHTEEGTYYVDRLHMDYGEINVYGKFRAGPQPLLHGSGNIILSQSLSKNLGGQFVYLIDNQGVLKIPMVISGSLKKPRVYPNMAKFIQQAATSQATRLIPKEVQEDFQGLLKDFGGILKKPQ